MNFDDPENNLTEQKVRDLSASLAPARDELAKLDAEARRLLRSPELDKLWNDYKFTPGKPWK